MPYRDPGDRTIDLYTKWLDSLPSIEDIELTTLKIHLLLEEMLRYLLAARLQIGESDLKDLDLDGNRLVNVALAGLETPHLKGSLRAVNRARNHMSHRLADPAFLDELHKFVTEAAYMKGNETKWPADVTGQVVALRRAFDDVASELLSMALVPAHRPYRAD